MPLPFRCLLAALWAALTTLRAVPNNCNPVTTDIVRKTPRPGKEVSDGAALSRIIVDVVACARRGGADGQRAIAPPGELLYVMPRNPTRKMWKPQAQRTTSHYVICGPYILTVERQSLAGKTTKYGNLLQNSELLCAKLRKLCAGQLCSEAISIFSQIYQLHQNYAFGTKMK